MDRRQAQFSWVKGIFYANHSAWRVHGESLRLVGPPERTPVLARCYTHRLGEVMPKVRGAAQPAGFRDLFHGQAGRLQQAPGVQDTLRGQPLDRRRADGGVEVPDE